MIGLILPIHLGGLGSRVWSTLIANRVFQWGREATKGAAVAATSKIAIDNIVFTATDEVARPAIADGIVVNAPGYEHTTKRGTTWTAKGPATYEQLQNWLTMTVKSVSGPGRRSLARRIR